MNKRYLIIWGIFFSACASAVILSAVLYLRFRTNNDNIFLAIFINGLCIFPLLPAGLYIKSLLSKNQSNTKLLNSFLVAITMLLGFSLGGIIVYYTLNGVLVQ
jgi:hypothetical protein